MKSLPEDDKQKIFAFKEYFTEILKFYILCLEWDDAKFLDNAYYTTCTVHTQSQSHTQVIVKLVSIEISVCENNGGKR